MAKRYHAYCNAAYESRGNPSHNSTAGWVMSRSNEQLSPDFGGLTYDAYLDNKRLTGLLKRVHAFMSDGGWHDLYEIAHYTGGTEASVSARLRDFRKIRYGSHVIDRRRVGSSGLFQYRLVP